ncbi:response regulator [Streptomyces sp. GMY02]|uniref:response regulator n=1 Tax=Streptomyces sp. GMY02 TaxID=1333528 RepID=UPI001C2C6B73|nr:response regulator [Streptomyces sp. GMY02]QXE36881.1 response regulator [Streptomyces sp. GMY02]
MNRSTGTTERASILLVDDMEDNLDALEAVLASLDQTLVRARSGEEAVRELLLRPFAVILLDVRMPGMDGFETAYRIKRLDRAKDIPIIFLNGPESGGGYAFHGYATGAADFLNKPFDPWVLRAKVSVFLDLHRKNREVERLLAREREQLGEIAGRLSSIEEALRRGAPDDLAALGKQLACIGETLCELRREQEQ